jgi:hypothetical protein
MYILCVRTCVLSLFQNTRYFSTWVVCLSVFVLGLHFTYPISSISLSWFDEQT